MNYSNNGDIKIWFCDIVGSDNESIGISTTSGFQIFHTDKAAAIVACSALFHQLGSDDIVFLGLNFQNCKRVILVRQDLDIDRQRNSGLALQMNLCRADFDKFNDFSGYNETEEGLCRVVGLHMYRFPLFPSPIIGGIEFDCNTSFLPGKDLPRTCRSSAASAGLDVQNIQRGIALIKKNEFMHDLRPFDHRLEFKHIFWKICLWSGLRIGCPSVA